MDSRKAAPCACGHHRTKAKEEEDVEIVTGGKVSQKEQDEVGEMLEKFFKRQAKSIIPKIGADAEWWNEDRWNKELADDLEPELNEIAGKHGEAIAKALGTEFSKDMQPFAMFSVLLTMYVVVWASHRLSNSYVLLLFTPYTLPYLPVTTISTSSSSVST